jgi:hypothetical protein
MIAYGDIIGCQGSDWLSDAIRGATGHGPLSHVAIVTATDPFVQVTEAISPRVTVTPFDALLARERAVWILSSPLSEFDRCGATLLALNHVGDEYALLDIVLQLLDSVTRSEWFTEHFTTLMRREVICSELAAMCESKLGLKPADATPNAFWDLWSRRALPIVQVK